MTKVVWSPEDEAYYVVCGDDSVWVPSGWDAIYSEDDQEWYFVVSSSGATPYSTWDPPCGLGWHAEWSEEHQLPYFVDEQTGESSWQRPSDTEHGQSSDSVAAIRTVRDSQEPHNGSSLLPINEFHVLLTHFAAILTVVQPGAQSEDSGQPLPEHPPPFITEAAYVRFGGQALAAASSAYPSKVVQELDADGDGCVSIADVLTTLGRHVVWDAHAWYTVVQVMSGGTMSLTTHDLNQICLSCGHPLNAAGQNVALQYSEISADDEGARDALDWQAILSVLEHSELVESA